MVIARAKDFELVPPNDKSIDDAHNQLESGIPVTTPCSF